MPCGSIICLGMVEIDKMNPYSQIINFETVFLVGIPNMKSNDYVSNASVNVDFLNNGLNFCYS